MTHIASKPTTYELANLDGGNVSPPSRSTNPFATCWTRPGAIAFRFPDGQNATQLITRLAALQGRGAIVGPHGSGKSTLLETLKPALKDAGFHIHAITLRNRQRRLPAEFYGLLPAPRAIAIIDGFEQLGWLDRFQISRQCRRAGVGLLVTAHTPTRLPTLIRLAPDERLAQRLVAELAAPVSAQITAADVAASHACHGGNLREMFFDLYDRHEQLRHAERTRGTGRAYRSTADG